MLLFVKNGFVARTLSTLFVSALLSFCLSQSSSKWGCSAVAGDFESRESTGRGTVDSESENFVLRDDQLKMLRRMVVGWSYVESGAPGVDYACTFGLQPNVQDPGPSIIGWMGLSAATPAQQKEAFEEFFQLQTAFDLLLNLGEIKPGHHSFKSHYKQMFPSGTLAFDGKQIPLPKNDVIDFELTEEHIKLLRHLNLRGLLVDPKRPYGDMTFFEIDMADALGIPFHLAADGKPSFTKAQMDHFGKLHTEMLQALQVMLLDGRVAAGKYHRKDGRWHRVSG
jgi:hypothetical protein